MTLSIRWLRTYEHIWSAGPHIKKILCSDQVANRRDDHLVCEEQESKMGYVIIILLIGLAIGTCFLIFVVLAVPWAEEKHREKAYKLLSESSPDPDSVKEAIEGLASMKDEETKEIIGKLVTRLIQEDEENRSVKLTGV